MKSNEFIIAASSIADKYAIPCELLIGVYDIETTYRKWYHRWAENTLVFIGALMNILFHIRIRNFTIGRCQVGIATILCRFGFPRYRHCAEIDKLSLGEFKYIIKAMTIRGSIDCCAWALKGYYQEEMMFANDVHTAIINVGQRYNGTYTYGILLDKICGNNLQYCTDCDYSLSNISSPI